MREGHQFVHVPGGELPPYGRNKCRWSGDHGTPWIGDGDRRWIGTRAQHFPGCCSSTKHLRPSNATGRRNRKGELYLRLAGESTFQLEMPLETLRWREPQDLYLCVSGPQPDRPPDPLGESHGRPRKIVVDDGGGVLEVQSFRDQIGGD